MTEPLGLKLMQAGNTGQ